MLAALCPAVPARASAASSSSLHGSNPMEGSLQTLMFHVHKAGGTALCDLAKKNGESISEYNCNLDDASKYGFSCDRDQASAQSADEQGAYLRTVVRYTFGADECLAPREPVAGVITLTSLRQPLERAASHFYYDAMYGNAEATRGDCSSFDCFVLQRMESDDYAKYYWHNFMTRFFSGTAHTGAIGERELESAKARLSGVDVLIDLNNYEASLATLKEWLPSWKDTSLPHENSSGGGARTVEMSPEAMAKLTEANQLDLALYEYFKSAAEKAARAAARHAASRAHGEQAAWEGVTQAPAPELERAFYGDSVRIVLAPNATAGV